MTINIPGINYLEGLLRLTNARMDFYKEMLIKTKDEFSKTIITRLINQSLGFIDDFANENPDLYPIINKDNKDIIKLREIWPHCSREDLTQAEVFQCCSEVESLILNTYQEILNQELPVPLLMILSQQFKDIQKGYERIQFLNKV